MSKMYYNGQLIETFIFDLDGTAFGFIDCVAYINSEGEVLAHICRTFKHTCMEDIHKLSQKYINADRKKWFKDILKEVCSDDPNYDLNFDIDAYVEDLEDLYWVTFSKLNVPYFDFVYFIEKIKPFCKLGIITDGYMKNQKTKIFSSILHKHFDVNNIVFSDEVNAKKPSREIFDYAHKKIGYKADTTAFVGDLLHKDIAGANDAGMLSIFLRRGSNICDTPQNEIQSPQITISNYYELLDLFEIR